MESQEQSSAMIIKPLVISMVGIVLTALSIITYHFILTRYCVRRANRTLQANDRSQKQVGVEEEVLKSIPVFAYSGKQEGFCRGDQTECSVCIGDLEEGDMVRLLPACQHAFHLRCIDEWLMSHSNCPVCRSSIETVPACSTTGLQMQVGVEELVDQGGVGNSSTHANNGLGTKKLRPKLRHCPSLILPNERRNLPLELVLKRSLSMDCSYVMVHIHGNHHKDLDSSSSSSSSSRADFLRSSLYRVRSSKYLDCASSMLIKSFSRLRDDANTSKGILPC